VEPFNVFSERCPSREVVDHITGRWPSLVLVALLDNPRRFAETARAVGGISDRMLSRTLSTLVADGLVTRTEQPDRSVSYALTDAGHRIAVSLQSVVATVYTVMPQVLAARASDA
jgi:DNA-binding HxlR family transcriptional regulator